MNDLQLVIREIQFRWVNFMLATGGIALAAAACTAIVMMHEAAQKETRRVQRDMGFNLRIIPKDADLDTYLLVGYVAETIPKEVVHRLAAHKTLAYNHLVAILQNQINVEGKPAILTGLSPTLFPPGQKRPPMSPEIEPGSAHLGFQVAIRLNAKLEEEIRINGESFNVARVAPETGTSDDLRIWVHLSDAQRMLEQVGQISEIRAIDCLCLTPDELPQQMLREEITRVAPEVQVAMLTSIASARAQQRRMIEELSQTALPGLVIVASVWVGLLAYLNIRQRIQELGILRALGYGSTAIATMVLAKAAFAGGIGGLVGSLVGSYLALAQVPRLFPITGDTIQLHIVRIVVALALSCIVACLAALVPATLAVAHDPAEVLRED